MSFSQWRFQRVQRPIRWFPNQGMNDPSHQTDQWIVFFFNPSAHKVSRLPASTQYTAYVETGAKKDHAITAITTRTFQQDDATKRPLWTTMERTRRPGPFISRASGPTAFPGIDTSTWYDEVCTPTEFMRKYAKTKLFVQSVTKILKVSHFSRVPVIPTLQRLPETLPLDEVHHVAVFPLVG